MGDCQHMIFVKRRNNDAVRVVHRGTNNDVTIPSGNLKQAISIITGVSVDNQLLVEMDDLTQYQTSGDKDQNNGEDTKDNYEATDIGNFYEDSTSIPSSSDDDDVINDIESFPLTTPGCRVIPPKDAAAFIASSIGDDFQFYKTDEILQVLLENSSVTSQSLSSKSSSTERSASDKRDHFLQTVESLVKHFDRNNKESFKRFQLRRVIDTSQLKETETQTSTPDNCDITMSDTASPKDLLPTESSNGYCYEFNCENKSLTSSEDNDDTERGDCPQPDRLETKEKTDTDADDHNIPQVTEEIHKADKIEPVNENKCNKFDPRSLDGILSVDIQALVDKNMKIIQTRSHDMSDVAQLYQKSLENVYQAKGNVSTTSSVVRSISPPDDVIITSRPRCSGMHDASLDVRMPTVGKPLYGITHNTLRAPPMPRPMMVPGFRNPQFYPRMLPQFYRHPQFARPPNPYMMLPRHRAPLMPRGFPHPHHRMLDQKMIHGFRDFSMNDPYDDSDDYSTSSSDEYLDHEPYDASESTQRITSGFHPQSREQREYIDERTSGEIFQHRSRDEDYASFHRGERSSSSYVDDVLPKQRSSSQLYNATRSTSYGTFVAEFAQKLKQPQLCHRDHKFLCDVMKLIHHLLPIMQWKDAVEMFKTATSKYEMISRSRNSAAGKECQTSKLLRMLVNCVIPDSRATPSLASTSTKLKCEEEVARLIYDGDIDFEYVESKVLLCKSWNERGVCSHRCTFLHYCIICAERDETTARHPMLECPL